MKRLRQYIRRILKETVEEQSLPFEFQSSQADLEKIFAMIKTSEMENIKQAIDLFNMLEGTDVEVIAQRPHAGEHLEWGAFKVIIPGGDFVENVGEWRTKYRVDANSPDYVHPFTVAAADHGLGIDEDLWRGLNSGWIYL